MHKVRLKIVLVYCCIYASCLLAQQPQSFYQQRFEQYLDFKKSLSPYVKIDAEGVKLYKDAASKSAGKSELVIFWDEVQRFNELVKKQPLDTLETLLKKKGEKKWAEKNIQSYLSGGSPATAFIYDPLSNKPLLGMKIAIDPGHTAGDMSMARIEQKYLHFSKDSCPGLSQDSINIAEGMLTFQTSAILKKMLEEQGAMVMLTREENSTAFGISFESWMKTRKKTVLDSLKATGDLTVAKHKQLMKADAKKLFWEFFKDLELAQRIRKVNAFHPDITVIIHYNVDEKNKDWICPSKANYTMAFIGGGMTADAFRKMRGKLHFLRLLLGEDLPGSEKLSALTVQQFAEQLEVPIARQNDADYLKDNCLPSAAAGVFCRNLALCRMINSPLVYGECLFQDNQDEMYRLCRQDKTYYGIVANDRVYQVANAYFEAIKRYCKK